jgi:AcrR family transcriptional regulator
MRYTVKGAGQRNTAEKDGTAVERTDGGRLGFLWRERDRRGNTPGPKRGLTAAQVVETAVELADAEGLDALTMQRVAKRLGMTAMSLYRYVPGKDELVEAMVDVAVGAPPDLSERAGWQDGVEAWGEALWACYLRHPWMVRAPVATPVAPNHLSWLESLLHTLEDTGLGYEEMISVAMFVSGAVQGLAKIALDSSPPGAGADAVPYDQALGAVVDAERYPTLTTVLTAGTFAQPGDGDLVPNLEFGMRQMLAGIELHVAKRNRNRGE